MIQFIDYEDFTLTVPDPEYSSRVKDRMKEFSEINQTYVDSLDGLPQEGKITGSFIYAHPPDYVGRPTVNYGKNEWVNLIEELKELGIDTLIYQAAAWLEVEEVYYSSKRFSDFKSWNSLEHLFKAVEDENVDLFLGGLGNHRLFDQNVSPDKMKEDVEMQLDCYEELIDHRYGFDGFYISPETAFPGEKDLKYAKVLNNYYSNLFRRLKDEICDLPVLMSPATFYRKEVHEEAREFLFNLFEGCEADIIAPQDSIGTFGNNLPGLEPSFEIWKELSQETGFTLWVNVESFERTTVGTPNDFEPADFERLLIQLRNAEKFGEKTISWEVPYFYSSKAGEKGEELRRKYSEHLRTG